IELNSRKKILSTNQAPGPEEKGRDGHAKKAEEEERTDTDLRKDPSFRRTSLTLHSAPFSSLSTALTPMNLCLLVPLAAGGGMVNP
uniref:Uncharacterized protein n=1 Tax=Capra hircus TaxID=9925 RepID=A0A8C2N5K8_CAPHI